jgi:hypothetical protein
VDTAAACGDIVQIPLTLTADADVQGFVAVFEWTGAAQGVGFTPSAVIQDADYLSTRVEDNYMVIAVVMDYESSVVIPAGTDIALGTVEIRCGGTGVATDITFADGKYSASEGGPITENVVVVRGQSIGAGNGLTLLNGQFSCEACIFELKLGTVTSCADIAQIPLTLTADEDVQGFVAVFEWAGAAQGVGYAPSAVIQGADYLSARVEDNYMVIAVVMNFESSVVIPAGADIALGTVEIRCGGTGVATDIIFADGKYAAYEGGPITENVLVVRGQSIGAGNGLTLLNGQFSCESCEGIPTLSEWGMSIMSLLLAGTAIWMIRRRKIA